MKEQGGSYNNDQPAVRKNNKPNDDYNDGISTVVEISFGKERHPQLSIEFPISIHLFVLTLILAALERR